MHLWEQNEAFPLLYPIKLGETNIWRNCSGNGPSVVIPFWEFSVVLLGDFEWGVWGEVRTIPGPFSLLQPRVMLPLSLLKIGCPVIYSYFFNWRVIALQYCVGFCCATAWISYMVHIFPPSCASRPPPDPHPTPLGRHRALGWACAIQRWPTSHLLETRWCIYVNPNLPVYPTLPFLPRPHSRFLHLCLYSCLANGFICTICLDSTYRH